MCVCVRCAVEIATLTREGGRTVIKVLPAEEVDRLITAYYEREEELKREAKAKEERAKQEKAAAAAEASKTSS